LFTVFCLNAIGQQFYFNRISATSSSTTIDNVATGSSTVGSVNPTPGPPAGYTRISTTFATGSLPGCNALGMVFKASTSSQLYVAANGNGAFVKIYSISSPTSGSTNYKSIITNYLDKDVRLNSSLSRVLISSVTSTGSNKTLTQQLTAGTTYYVTSYSPNRTGGTTAAVYSNSFSSFVLPP
jgi:hypothetical protein